MVKVYFCQCLCAHDCIVCLFVCCACTPYGVYVFSLALYVYINVIHYKFVYIFLFPLTPSVFFSIHSYTYARTHIHSKTNKQIHVVFTGIWSSLFTANGSMSARTERVSDRKRKRLNDWSATKIQPPADKIKRNIPEHTLAHRESYTQKKCEEDKLESGREIENSKPYPKV